MHLKFEGSVRVTDDKALNTLLGAFKNDFGIAIINIKPQKLMIDFYYNGLAPDDGSLLSRLDAMLSCQILSGSITGTKNGVPFERIYSIGANGKLVNAYAPMSYVEFRGTIHAADQTSLEELICGLSDLKITVDAICRKKLTTDISFADFSTSEFLIQDIEGVLNERISSACIEGTSAGMPFALSFGVGKNGTLEVSTPITYTYIKGKEKDLVEQLDPAIIAYIKQEIKGHRK